MRIILSLSCIALTLASCSAPPKETAPNELRVPFACDNGEEIEVRFSSDQRTAVLNRSGRTIKLPQQISGSGFIYGNGAITLRGKGDDLIVEIGRMVPLRCKALRGSR